jgi:hypothetical protein
MSSLRQKELPHSFTPVRELWLRGTGDVAEVPWVAAARAGVQWYQKVAALIIFRPYLFSTSNSP